MNHAVYHDAGRALPPVILYGRAACDLCDEARAVLAELLDRRSQAGLPAPAVVERDIDSNASWQSAFFADIPVIEIGDRRLLLATSATRIDLLLSEALDR